jgi:hypothetical protein
MFSLQDGILGREDAKQHDDEFEQEQASNPVRALSAPPLRSLTSQLENDTPRCAAREAGMSREKPGNANWLSLSVNGSWRYRALALKAQHRVLMENREDKTELQLEDF